MSSVLRCVGTLSGRRVGALWCGRWFVCLLIRYVMFWKEWLSLLPCLVWSSVLLGKGDRNGQHSNIFEVMVSEFHISGARQAPLFFFCFGNGCLPQASQPAIQRSISNLGQVSSARITRHGLYHQIAVRPSFFLSYLPAKRLNRTSTLAQNVFEAAIQVFASQIRLGV